MKVLVVSLNRERIPDVVAPLGCAYVLETLLESGHSADFLDLLPSETPLEDLRHRVVDTTPDLVALSVRNLDCSVEPQRKNVLPWIREVVQTLKACDVAILIGGSGFSLLPERFLEALDLDIGLAGPCERSLPKFLQHFHQREAWPTIPGLAWRDEQGVIHVNASQPWGIPAKAPARGWEFLDAEYYHQEGGAINLQTKRGCAFRCTFCTYPKLEGELVLQREAMGVVDEIQWWMEERGVKHFFFVDSVFNAPAEHARAILNEMLRRNLRPSWTAYINPLGLEGEMVDLMLESGCIGIEMGIDSGSDLILRKLKKGFLPSQVQRALSACSQSGLKTCVNLIFGSPGENLSTVNETIDLLNRFPDLPVISMVGVRIYPGTPIHQTAEREGLVNRHTDFLQPTFYFSPQFDQSCMNRLIEQAGARRNWVIPDVQINTNLEFFQRLRKRRFKGPMWRVLSAAPPSV